LHLPEPRRWCNG